MQLISSLVLVPSLLLFGVGEVEPCINYTCSKDNLVPVVFATSCIPPWQPPIHTHVNAPPPPRCNSSPWGWAAMPLSGRGTRGCSCCWCLSRWASWGASTGCRRPKGRLGWKEPLHRMQRKNYFSSLSGVCCVQEAPYAMLGSKRFEL